MPPPSISKNSSGDRLRICRVAIIQNRRNTALALVVQQLLVQGARIAREGETRRGNSNWPGRCRPPRWRPSPAEGAGHKRPHPIPAERPGIGPAMRAAAAVRRGPS